MVTLKNQRMAKSGPNRFFTVPRKLIESEVLDPDKSYTLNIEEEVVGQKEKKKKGTT